jgi:hypothetical protein
MSGSVFDYQVRTSMTADAKPVTPERILQFAWGYVPPLVIEAAIRHHIFDLLDGGPKNIAELSGATGASERGLAAIMNALDGSRSRPRARRF